MADCLRNFKKLYTELSKRFPSGINEPEKLENMKINFENWHLNIFIKKYASINSKGSKIIYFTFAQKIRFEFVWFQVLRSLTPQGMQKPSLRRTFLILAMLVATAPCRMNPVPNELNIVVILWLSACDDYISAWELASFFHKRFSRFSFDSDCQQTTTQRYKCGCYAISGQ